MDLSVDIPTLIPKPKKEQLSTSAAWTTFEEIKFINTLHGEKLLAYHEALQQRSKWRFLDEDKIMAHKRLLESSTRLGRTVTWGFQ